MSMRQLKTTGIALFGVGLGLLSGCASLQDMERMEQAIRDADAKAERAMATAQSCRDDIKAADEKARQNQYLP